MDRESYYRYVRNKSEQSYHDQQKALDQVVIGLSTGTVALSITFLENIAGNQPQKLELLYLAWGFLIFTTFLHIFSYATSIISSYKTVGLIDSWFIDKKGDQTRAPHEKVFNFITIFLNSLSIATLVVGVTILALFASLNIDNKNHMPKKADSSSQEVKTEKGLAPLPNEIMTPDKESTPKKGDESED